jgi:catechol 2,3-dioxygenase-like lactoylglutathione lyase family enzyme
MKVDALDHFVLTCADMEASVRFYTGVLGMELVVFGESRKALRFGDMKINLHQQGKEFEPKAQQALPGSADLCFITSVPIDQVIEHLNQCEVSIIYGPVEQTGAISQLRSVYFRDPDQNLIEVANKVAS